MDTDTKNENTKETNDDLSNIAVEEGTGCDIKKATVSSPEAEAEKKPKLSIKEVNNKLMGLVYGCVLGEIMGLSNGTLSENSEWGFSTDQLMLTMETLTETGMMHVGTLLQKFQVYSKKGMLELGDDHNNIDEYSKEVVVTYEALADPAKVSFDQFAKYNKLAPKGEDSLNTCDNTPLIRCVMVGLYNDWDSFSFAATMATHADH